MGWVIIATFSWRQSRHLLDILLVVRADFITFQVMLGVMFLSFNFQMYADRFIVQAFFICKQEFVGIYSLFESSLHCAYVVFC